MYYNIYIYNISFEETKKRSYLYKCSPKIETFLITGIKNKKNVVRINCAYSITMTRLYICFLHGKYFRKNPGLPPGQRRITIDPPSLVGPTYTG